MSRLPARTAHGMSEFRAAGWYPDPHDDSSECWWGGTAWTASTRPLNHAPAQATPPPLPGAIALPPPGWYPDPQNAAGEKWFDGAGWTQVTRQRASQRYAGAPGQPVGVPGQPVGVPGRPRFRWVAYTNIPVRTSKISGSVGALLVGLIFLGMGTIFVVSSRAPANMSATATGTVTGIQIHERTSSSSSTPTCIPVASFGVGGKTYTASMRAGSSPCPYAVGQQIAVAYDPASPANAIIPATGIYLYMPWLFAGIGALTTGGSLFSLVRSAARSDAGGSLLVRMWRLRKPATSLA